MASSLLFAGRIIGVPNLSYEVARTVGLYQGGNSSMTHVYRCWLCSSPHCKGIAFGSEAQGCSRALGSDLSCLSAPCARVWRSMSQERLLAGRCGLAARLTCRASRSRLLDCACFSEVVLRSVKSARSAGANLTVAIMSGVRPTCTRCLLAPWAMPSLAYIGTGSAAYAVCSSTQLVTSFICAPLLPSSSPPLLECDCLRAGRRHLGAWCKCKCRAT